MSLRAKWSSVIAAAALAGSSLFVALPATAAPLGDDLEGAPEVAVQQDPKKATLTRKAAGPLTEKTAMMMP